MGTGYRPKAQRTRLQLVPLQLAPFVSATVGPVVFALAAVQRFVWPQMAAQRMAIEYLAGQTCVDDQIVTQKLVIRLLVAQRKPFRRMIRHWAVPRWAACLLLVQEVVGHFSSSAIIIVKGPQKEQVSE